MADNVESQARAMGWVPKEQFRGDEAKWVSAEEFVSRGEHVMPILKANNRRLQAQVDELSTQLTEARETITAAQESIEALKQHQTESTRRAVDNAMRNLRQQIAQAREDGNVELELELTDQLADTREAKRKVEETPPKTPAAPAASPAPKADPEFVAWRAENTWFGTDRRKTALAIAIAEELRADPANKGLVGRAFYDRAAEEAEATLNPRSSSSKVETGSGSGTPTGGRSKGGKTFADLPQEAKDMCESQAPKMVGKGRAFKEKKDWQAHYAEQYFLVE